MNDQEQSLVKATENLLFIRVSYLDLSFTVEVPFSPLFSSSQWFMALISSRTFSLGCCGPAAAYYLACHKNTNLRGRPHFTAWQVETEENCLWTFSHIGMKYTFYQLLHCFYRHTEKRWWILLIYCGLCEFYCTHVTQCQVTMYYEWIASVIVWGIAKKLLKEVWGQSLRPFPNRLKTGIMHTPDNRDHNLSAMHNWALLGKIIINLCVSHRAAINQEKHNPVLPLCLSLPLAHLLPLSWP